MEIKDRILAKSKEMFFRFGVRSVTMDDVAKELGISKKTIYQHFEDKDQIVLQMTSHEMENDKCEWDELSKVSENILDKMVRSMDLMKATISDMNPTIIYDIKKYHPKAWAMFQSHKQNFFLQEIIKDINKGIEEGFFRKEIDVKILARMRIEEIDIAFNPDVFPHDQFNIINIHTMLLDHFLRGIFTEKGLKVYQKYQNK